MDNLDNTPRKHKIYKYTNLITGMSYIGQTCRPLQHRAGKDMTGYRTCVKFWEAINIYGTDCWSVEILWEGLSLEEANIYEDLEILDNETLYPYGYNSNEGGMEGRCSQETRKKMSERRLGMSQEAFMILIGWLLRSNWTPQKITRELQKDTKTIYKYAKRANLKIPKPLTRKGGNKSTFRRETEIRIAAWQFINNTRDATEIGKKVGISARTVHRYAEDPLWEQMLEEWGYVGPRNFRVRGAGRKRKSA